MIMVGVLLFELCTELWRFLLSRALTALSNRDGGSLEKILGEMINDKAVIRLPFIFC